MNHFFGYARALDTTIQTTGVTSGPAVAAPYPGVAGRVYNAGTEVLASIYADAAGTIPFPNPFSVNTDGQYSFYGAASVYDLFFSTGVIDRTTREIDVPAYATANFPTPGGSTLRGRLALRTDGIGGLWMDSGDAWVSRSGEVVNVKDYPFLAKGDGSSDDTTAVQAAITAADGRTVYVPPGTYVITATLTDIPSSLVGRNRGTIIKGAGRFKTIFDNRVANGPMLRIDTGSDNQFQLGSCLKGFQIKTTTSPASSIGIEIKRQQQIELKDVYVRGLTGDGLKFSLTTGDADASTHITLKHCWVYQCAGWGINCNLASGRNELSYLELDNTRIETCGTTSALSDPPSGGMRWKGQVLKLDKAAFVTNENVGLVIYAGAGASNDVRSMGSSFENNKKRHLWIQTLSAGLFDTTQFYSNDSYVATKGVDLTATGGGAVQRVKFVNSIVRASSGNNPYTAFTLDANCQDCSIYDTTWDDFDHAGQTRYSATSFAVGHRIIDDGVFWWGGYTNLSSASRGTIVSNNAKGLWGLNGSGNNAFPLVQMTAANDVQIGSSSTRTKLDQAPTHIQIVATGSLPAAGASENGRVLIEDAGAGVFNRITYAGGARFRASAGVSF